MSRAWTTLIVMVTTGLASATAMAGDPLNLYLGAGLGESEITRDDNYLPYFNEHHFAWEAIAGVRPISLVGVELQYIDFGDPSAGPNYNFASAHSNAKAAALFGVGYLPLPAPFLDIYAKLGVARLHSNTSAVVPGLCPPGAFCPVQIIVHLQQDEWSTGVDPLSWTPQC
jgi:hypothetical protein